MLLLAAVVVVVVNTVFQSTGDAVWSGKLGILLVVRSRSRARVEITPALFCSLDRPVLLLVCVNAFSLLLLLCQACLSTHKLPLWRNVIVINCRALRVETSQGERDSVCVTV